MFGTLPTRIQLRTRTPIGFIGVQVLILVVFRRRSHYLQLLCRGPYAYAITDFSAFGICVNAQCPHGDDPQSRGKGLLHSIDRSISLLSQFVDI